MSERSQMFFLNGSLLDLEHFTIMTTTEYYICIIKNQSPLSARTRVSSLFFAISNLDRSGSILKLGRTWKCSGISNVCPDATTFRFMPWNKMKGPNFLIYYCKSGVLSIAMFDGSVGFWSAGEALDGYRFKLELNKRYLFVRILTLSCLRGWVVPPTYTRERLLESLWATPLNSASDRSW
jgi:hypothetical protein